MCPWSSGSAFTSARIQDIINRLTDSQERDTDDHTAQQASTALPPATRDSPAAAPPSTPAPIPPWSPPGSPRRSRTDAGPSNGCSLHQNPEPRQRLTWDQISTLVPQVGELTTALAEADPGDRAEVYRQLGLTLTYYPEIQKAASGCACTRTRKKNWFVSRSTGTNAPLLPIVDLDLTLACLLRGCDALPRQNDRRRDTTELPGGVPHKVVNGLCILVTQSDVAAQQLGARKRLVNVTASPPRPVGGS
jgi:hypothetical protein